MKDAAAFLAGKGSDRQTHPSDTVPEERGKEAARSLQPLTYLEPDHDLVQAAGLDAETARAFGAGYAPKGIMRGRLAIPIHDWQGTLIAIRLADGQINFRQSPERIWLNRAVSSFLLRKSNIVRRLLLNIHTNIANHALI